MEQQASAKSKGAGMADQISDERAAVSTLVATLRSAGIRRRILTEIQRLEARDLAAYLERQIAWSRATFGEGRRTMGILNHIGKELGEIAADPGDRVEWVDVMILAMDGYWRHGGTPEQLAADLQAKQEINIARTWPAPGPEDQPIEHVRPELVRSVEVVRALEEMMPLTPDQVTRLAESFAEADCKPIDSVTVERAAGEQS